MPHRALPTKVHSEAVASGTIAALDAAVESERNASMLARGWALVAKVTCSEYSSGFSPPIILIEDIINSALTI